MSNYKISDQEKELTRWAMGCALEMMMDNLTEGDDEDYINLESSYDGLIENWQEYANEELEEIKEGLSAFVMDGSGRFGRYYNKDRQDALRAEQIRYCICE